MLKFFNLMAKKHENYRELVWMLAKTDFKLRYHGSVLGYFWAILKPLLMFAILNFVFSSIFNPKNGGNPYYSLQLLTGIMLFTFFSEGSSSGLQSLMSKAQLVTKIYVPRWTIILASTINAVLVYSMNLIVVVFFFSLKGFLPSAEAILFFALFSILTYVLIVAFSFLTAPLYVKFRDLSMIWEVIMSALFYATPIIYPLSIMPEYIQRTLLINPLAFIVHFTKTALIENRFPEWWQLSGFIAAVIIAFFLSLLAYKYNSKRIAENI